VYYPAGLFDSPVFKRRLSQKCKAFPVSGKACEEVLSIPVHPLLEQEDIKWIIENIKAYLKDQIS
jgi:dTDP-4-amino-4,6-dideoxygalactose transaminase